MDEDCLSSITVAVQDNLKSHPDIEKLAKDFKSYKEGRNPGRMFGRDELYDRPPRLKLDQLQHVHVLQKKDRNFRHFDQYRRTSDNIVVYTNGFMNPKAFLIIAILQPNGHEKQRDTSYMLLLADYASDFRGCN